MPTMAMKSATTAALLVASGVVLNLSGCRSKPTKTFLSIQTSRIETTTFSPVIEAVSPLESASNLAVKPRVNGTVLQILVKIEAPFNAANFTNIVSAFTGILIVEVAMQKLEQGLSINEAAVHPPNLGYGRS